MKVQVKWGMDTTVCYRYISLDIMSVSPLSWVRFKVSITGKQISWGLNLYPPLKSQQLLWLWWLNQILQVADLTVLLGAARWCAPRETHPWQKQPRKLPKQSTVGHLSLCLAVTGVMDWPSSKWPEQTEKFNIIFHNLPTLAAAAWKEAAVLFQGLPFPWEAAGGEAAAFPGYKASRQ